MATKTIFSLLVITAALVGVHAVPDSSPASAQDAGAPAPAAISSAHAQTTVIVDGANAFLGTLSDKQRAAVLFEFHNPEQRARWSNLPEGIFPRTGMAWGELDEGQRAALMGLLRAVLGPEGVANVQEQMAADDALPAPGAGPEAVRPAEGLEAGLP